MDSEITQAIQRELTCTVCFNYLLDPVTIGCGHTFCRSCLCLSWEAAQGPAHCPVCRQPSQQKHVKTDIRVKKMSSLARKISLWQFLRSEEQICETHKQTKKMFCDVDKSLLCLLCSKSQEHRGHRHCPIEVSVEDQREKLVMRMKFIWNKIQENKRNLNEESTIINHWMDYVSLLTNITKTEYRKLHPVLYKEEEQHLEKLREEGQNILQQLKRSKAKMHQKSKHLRKMYNELIETCHKPDQELLQDLGDLLMRSGSVQLCMPQLVHPELSARPITGLMYRHRRFGVEISFNTAVTNHNMFDDVRNFRFRSDNQDASLNSGRSIYFAKWGAQAFTSGKHYWELDVNDSWDWAVGVCKDSWVSSLDTVLESEGVFLLLCVKEDNRCTLFTTSPMFPHYVEKPLGRVGVFLDLESGSVSFLNVAKSSLIWKYPAGSFSVPVRPFFLTGHR
uniref:Uncharacterized protein n=1 Tax=Prolemur simus TaxID=1328070 RepID=A0A8C8ZAF6_PROSS